MRRLDIALLGPPRITVDGKPAETDRHKAIGLLAYLATEAKPQSRESLATLFWPDYPRASALSYLRRTLWELNQMLGKGWIESQRDQVTLARIPGLNVDVEAFQRYLDRDSDQVSELTKAVQLYRGDFLENLVIADTAPFEEWQTQQAEYYRREFGHSLERLVEAYEKSGEHERALPFARRWLSLDRLNENAYRAIMRQLAGMDNRSEAIRIYQNCVQTLESELGVEPQAETEELYKAILHGDQLKERSVKTERTPMPGEARITGNLPSPTTPFIGRQEEIKQVSRLVLNPDVHLMTLTGLGGTGKTRLSIQVAAEVVRNFPDGAWFIPLAPVQSLQGIILAIAKGLNFSFYQKEEAPRQQLLDYLREKHILLILDNFEHLVEGGRELVADILEVGPGVRLMITSRQRLNLQTEQIYSVPGMQIPDQGTTAGWDDPIEQAKSYSAIQLLLDRARRVRPDFILTRDNLNAVTQICQLVEGSPLGIELASAWLELLPPEEIAKEINYNLDFLISQAADIPDRQRSLRGVFDTSWKLLNSDEQQAFKRLCVFRGSFSRQAAQSVSGTRLQTLLNLANKSWLQQTENGRYQLHEVLRQYGIESLETDQTEWQEARDRHAEYFSTFMQAQAQSLRTAGQIQALQSLKIEMESNIPEAWAWLVLSCHIDDLIEKMLPGLFHYWLIRGGSNDFISMLKHARKSVPCSNEGKDELQRAILGTIETNLEMNLAVYDDHPKEALERLWVMVDESNLIEAMGFWYIILIVTYGTTLNYEEGSRRFMEIMPKMTMLQDPWESGYIYLVAAMFTNIEQQELRNKYLTAALAIFQDIGVVQEQGIVLRVLGELAAFRRDYKQAIEHGQTALRLSELVGDDHGVDATWTNLADYYIYTGKIDQAFNAFEKIRNYHEKNGNRRMLESTLSWESLATSRYGKLEDALSTRMRGREIAMEVGNPSDIAWHTWELGEIYRLLGDVEHAKKYYQEALPTFEKIQEFLGLGFYHRGCGDIAMMQGDWEKARDEFQAALLSHEKEQRYSRNWGLIYYHARLGTALVHLGRFGEAKQQFNTSLSLAEKWHFQDIKALPLIGIASLHAATGHPSQAIEIAACVANQPTTWNEVKKQANKILEDARVGLPPEEAYQCLEQGKGLEIDQLSRQYLDSPYLA